MNIAENKLTDDMQPSSKHTILLVIYSFISITCLAYTSGYILGHFLGDYNGTSFTTGLKIGAMVTIIIISTYAAIRTYKIRKTIVEPPTKKENIRNNLLIISGIIGGIIGVILAVQAINSDELSLNSIINAPIPTLLALALAFFWAIIMPIICYYWYKNVDEQEMHAVRIGAYYSLYIYMIGAPTWWILWRGGLVPQPNGIIIYIITVYSFCGIWLWKKYRG